MGWFEDFQKNAGGVIDKVTAVTSYPANAAANAIVHALPVDQAAKDAQQKRADEQATIFVAAVAVGAGIAGVGALVGGADDKAKNAATRLKGEKSELAEFGHWLLSLVGLR